MAFRIGVNFGEGEQIYGDAVNVAARLESLAERATSISRARLTTRCAISSRWVTKIAAGRRSRISRDPCRSGDWCSVITAQDRAAKYIASGGNRLFPNRLTHAAPRGVKSIGGRLTPKSKRGSTAFGDSTHSPRVWITFLISEVNRPDVEPCGCNR
jgi:hypothetical protein